MPSSYFADEENQVPSILIASSKFFPLFMLRLQHLQSSYIIATEMLYAQKKQLKLTGGTLPKE